jgi:arginine exporter protein ArgO
MTILEPAIAWVCNLAVVVTFVIFTGLAAEHLLLSIALICVMPIILIMPTVFVGEVIIEELELFWRRRFGPRS